MTASVFASRDFVPSAADKALKARQQAEYVKELWIFIASVIALLALIRYSRLGLSLLLRRLGARDEPIISEKPTAVQPGKNGRISWRRIPSAFSSAFRIVAFRLHVPVAPRATFTISELTFIYGYIIAIFVWLLINTQGLDTWFFEDRAAHFASCQLPLVVALAGKNNLISFLTGVGHEKLNVLHRAAARTCLILLWMHAICRALGGLTGHFDLANGWMRCGVVGLTAFTLATILSIRPIRNMFFEFFLITHIVLIGVFLITGYLHARRVRFGDYIWPALVLWAFDRFLRLGRLFWNSLAVRAAQNFHTTAEVELLSEDTVRLTLRRHMHWTPGQHAYVILPTVSDLPFEAHPFTIASIPHGMDGSSGPEAKEITFLIRGRSGFTGRLRDHAASASGSTVPAFIDGPYGCPPDLTVYNTCILIAGGSGVSYTLPLLQNLVYKARGKSSNVRRVVFVWAVRDSEHLKWISKALTEAMEYARTTSLVIEPRLYITGPQYTIPELPAVNADPSDGSVTPLSSKSDEKLQPPAYSALKITHGRPSIRRLLQDEIAEASGPVSVDVAGPTPLSQSVARVLSTGPASPMSVLKGGPSVTLHVETFGMVH
ncbi:hypothetical protein K474DRAFT_1585791 [Panus rudis PR-1116 ss-1]|nr:hypothetical protein K474DRAFT_1585791 [Panus rudis PR-1116 ss-1]